MVKFSLTLHMSLNKISFINLTVCPFKLPMSVLFSFRKITFIDWLILVGLFSKTLWLVLLPVSVISKFQLIEFVPIKLLVPKYSLTIEAIIFEITLIIRAIRKYQEPVLAFCYTVVELSMKVYSSFGEYLSFAMLFASIPTSFVEDSSFNHFEHWQFLNCLFWLVKFYMMI